MRDEVTASWGESQQESRQIILPSSLVLSPYGVVLVYPLICAHRTTTLSSCAFCEQKDGLMALYPPLLRLQLSEHKTLTRQSLSYVSIISNRASNSCPQAVQRMQSDSTVNSSALIPIPPQSGQRARWIL